MIVWRGWGLLALLVAVAINVFFEQWTDRWGIPDGFRHYRDAYSWVWFVGFALSALACWFLGRWLEARELRHAQVLTDKTTGQDVRLVGRHDMFWIPLKWWSLVWLAVAVWFGLGR